MTKLRDYLAVKRTELHKALAPLERQRDEIEREIARLHQELSELGAAAKAIGIVNGLDDNKLIATRREPPTITIKEAALKILQEFPQGLIAWDILAKVNDRYGLGIVRTSLSPQLSRLKREGKITNRGSTWLPIHPNKKGSADLAEPA